MSLLILAFVRKRELSLRLNAEYAGGSLRYFAGGFHEANLLG